ncbi:CHAT domain-containing protein [Duganella sp. CF458]|nr:CHAT domain-containing protein [Duganella sp. CF458]
MAPVGITIRQAVMLAALACASLHRPASAGMEVMDLPRLTSPGFCDIARWDRRADLESAASSYRQGRNRDAAGESAAVSRQANDPATRYTAAILQARALKVMACDDAAMALLDTMLRSPEFLSAPRKLYCLALSRLARLTVTRQMDEAMRLAKKAKECAEKAGQSEAGSEALNTMAIISLSRSACRDAGKWASEAISVAPDALRKAEGLRTHGQWLELCERDARSAMADYAASEREANEAGDPEALAWAQVFSSTTSMKGNMPSAAVPEKLDLAFKSAQAGELRRAMGAALVYHAFALARSEYGSLLAIAVRELSVSAELHAAFGHRSQERMIQIALGGYLVSLGRYADARAAFERGRRLALDSGLPTEAAKALQGLAAIARLSSPQDSALAAKLMQQVLAELRAADHTPGDLGRALFEAATIEAGFSNFAKASEYFRDSLAYAVEGKDTDAIAMAQASLGWSESRADNPIAANLAWRAAVAGDSPQARAMGWWGLARSSRYSAPLVAAGRYARVIHLVEQMRPTGPEDAAHQTFDRRFSEAYREFQSLLMDLQSYKQAKKIALLMNRRELVERQWVRGTRSADEGNPAVPAIAPDPLEQCGPQIAQRERRVLADQEKLALLARDLPRKCCAEDGSVRVNAECSAHSALKNYCELRHSADGEGKALLREQDDCVAAIAAQVKVDELVQSALKTNGLTSWQRELERVPGHVVVTVIDQGELRVLVGGPDLDGYRSTRKAIDLKRLDALSAALQESWTNAAKLAGSTGTVSRAKLVEETAKLREGPLRELYELLFAGFDPPALPANPRPGALIIFLNDPLLRDLPMAALFDGQKYMGERYAIVHPTLRTLEHGKHAAGVTDSLVMGVSKPDLPNVEGEVQTVAAALKTDGFLNEQSTRERLFDWLRGGTAQGLVLHLASHGEMGGTSTTSLIRLWNGQVLNGDDLSDRQKRPRSIQLLTLSACRSALTGDGVMALGLAGLADNFASSAIGSLWKVDDRSTGRLMGAFYGNWRHKPDAGVANALAAAQRELMKDFAHPYFWASFIVVGRWD